MRGKHCFLGRFILKAIHDRVFLHVSILFNATAQTKIYTTYG